MSFKDYFEQRLLQESNLSDNRIIIGHIYGEGLIKSEQKMLSPIAANHFNHGSLGMSKGLRWRYRPKTGLLGWNLKPDEDEFELIKQHLLKRGFEIKRMASMGEPWVFRETHAGDTLNENAQLFPRAVFYIGDIEIIRNPLDSDYKQLNVEYRKEYPRDRSGNPSTRFTTDALGNRWIWRSDYGIHSQIEPKISEIEGRTVGQNESWLNESDERKYPLASKNETGAYAGDIDWKGKIIYMSPDKFLQLARKLPYDLLNFDSLKHLKQRMKENLPIDTLVLQVDMPTRKIIGHEGRHRAMVAKELGIKEVPVLIFTGSGYTRTPRWTDEQHREVEDAVNFQPEK